ncbi:complement C1q and tumor necrosis factor-related protein 9B-like [Ruditapes philippinarum]|uniref:complement C1q and tumor necrosis factor-related protein 9B-like n=1 Tax=Ruditapes philippinarum TaxID=129788 RepID=UPI00295BA4E0|nr:complement C1q and tumor necrosis factor-related protein 9B-like [Ruditapes philippinarum]
MLETMVRMEAKMDQWDKERKIFEENVLAILEHRREEMQEKFLKQNEKLENIFENFKGNSGNRRNWTIQLKNITGSVITTPKIAFNAYTISSGSYGINTPVKFPNVLLNIGDGYDKSTGIFTAPVTGLYFFSAHICNYDKGYMIISFIHEGTAVATTTEYENSGESCSSVSAPAMMKIGEKVSTKSVYHSSKLKANTIYRWPSFAGVLLHV